MDNIIGPFRGNLGLVKYCVFGKIEPSWENEIIHRLEGGGLGKYMEVYCPRHISLWHNRLCPWHNWTVLECIWVWHNCMSLVEFGIIACPMDDSFHNYGTPSLMIPS